MSQSTLAGHISAWGLYLAHQLALWGIIWYAQTHVKIYTTCLHRINVIALGVNALFIVLHLLQTHIWYDGLAQDVSVYSSQASVIVLLIWVMLMENNQRGLFFGKRAPISQRITQFARKYHGYYFAWAAILMGRGDDKPVAYQNGYAPSNAWVRSFTLALAKENAKTGISINAFNPGLVNTDLLRKIDAVEGYEQKLKAFSGIIRLFGNGPGVPAERALWLASSATDGKTGLEVRVLGLRQQLQGAGHELARLMLRRPAPDTSLDITVLAAYKMAAGETSAGQADRENQLGTQNTASSTQNNVDIHQVL